MRAIWIALTFAVGLRPAYAEPAEPKRKLTLIVRPADAEPTIIEGSRDPASVARVVSEHASEIKKCYENGLRRNGALVGKVTVKATLAASGAIVAAGVEDSTLKDPLVERCIVDRVESWEFPTAPGSGNLRFLYPFIFQGPATKLVLASKASEVDPLLKQGEFDKEIIRRVIGKHLDEVRTCYETALARKPTLTGKVMINFTISGSGAVVSSVVQQSTLNEPSVERCIAARVKAWMFPKPQNGGTVIVSYPFVLKTAGMN